MSKNKITPREGAVKFKDIMNDKNRSFGNKAGYFWEYYKWHTFAVVLAIVTLAFVIVPMIGRTPRDAYILYAGPRLVNLYQRTALEEDFQSVLTIEDRQAVIRFHPMGVVTPEQADRLRREAIEAGRDVPFFNDPQESLRAFNNEMMIGNTVIVLLSPELFEFQASNDRLMPLASVLDVVPDFALNDYGIRFADTAYARYFDSTNPLPNDTVLAIIHRPLHMSQAHHARGVDFFRQIVDFVPSDS